MADEKPPRSDTPEPPPAAPVESAEKQRELLAQTSASAIDVLDVMGLAGTGGQELALLQASFSGPFPPPRMLAQYREVQDDFPERLLKAWEEESKHRRAQAAG